MEIKANNIEGFEPNNFNDKFFLDSNVWLYLILPQYSNIASNLIKKYSSLFEKIQRKECIILTDIIQISELVNLIVRIEFKIYIKKNKSTIEFKDFRATEEGKKALVDAKTLIQTITRSATLASGIFTPDELKRMADSCDKADFNDIFFANFCLKRGAILVTHDFDFKALDMNLYVLSANNNYF